MAELDVLMRFKMGLQRWEESRYGFFALPPQHRRLGRATGTVHVLMLYVLDGTDGSNVSMPFKSEELNELRDMAMDNTDV